ncbi:MAG: FeoA domain-containing protein [Ardenticatenaceae bacterium]|nr:FeoA domain-containing protein [Ardenticatenaceae bacterium]
MPDPLLSLGIAVLIIAIGSLLFWPERGLVSRWQQNQHMTERIHSEDALKHIHKCEMKGNYPTVESIAGALHVNLNETAAILNRMQADKLLVITKGEIHLTPQGREAALHIIRAHRLWERYLAEETGFPEAEWHGKAEKYEHMLTPEAANALAMQLGNPTHDPHGDPIPTAEGKIETHGGQALTAVPVDTLARIVHLEDEPEIVYAQLAAEGLHPGMFVRVMESSPERVRFWANGNEHILAPMVATNISVVPVPAETKVKPSNGQLLGSLKLGETAEVTSLSPTCRGAERRRFMDLGILPGTKITAELRSPSGEPTAYRIRGAVIALRQSQANMIHVKPAVSQ